MATIINFPKSRYQIYLWKTF